MALGASQSRVRRDGISRTLRLALTGIGIGLVASVALASLLFRTAPTAPLTSPERWFCSEVLHFFRGISRHDGRSKINPTVALRTN